MKLPRILELLVLITLVLSPLVVYPILLAQFVCMALLACSLNLLFGYAGLLSFGHAAFFGVAAYATGYAMKEWGLTPEVGVVFGAVVAMTLGAAFGSLATRRQGIYFSMITLALAQLVYFAVVRTPFTHNEDGYQGIPRGRLFGLVDMGNDLVVYYFVLAVAVLAFFFVHRTVNSPFGEALKGIRDNEARATSLGYNVRVYKVMTFTLSAGVAGLAGSLKTLVFGLASLSDVHWHLSGDAIIMVILGGAGTLIGPVFGASVLVLVHRLLEGELIALTPVVLGAIFIVCVLAFRRGVIGQLLHVLDPSSRWR